MIKEIRLQMHHILGAPPYYSIMHLLKEKGFPCNDSVLDPKPKDGLTYFEFHDYKTDEIVIQWEEN